MNENPQFPVISRKLLVWPMPGTLLMYPTDNGVYGVVRVDHKERQILFTTKNILDDKSIFCLPEYIA